METDIGPNARMQEGGRSEAASGGLGEDSDGSSGHIRGHPDDNHANHANQDSEESTISPRVVPRDILWGRYLLRERRREIQKARAELMDLGRSLRNRPSEAERSADGSQNSDSGTTAELPDDIDWQQDMIATLEKESGRQAP